MKVNYDDLIKDIQVNELKPIYLLYGVEQYFIDEAFKKIKKKYGKLELGNNYVVLDSTTIDDLITNVDMPSFGYDKKLIIVKDSGLFKKIDKRKKDPEDPKSKEIREYIEKNYDDIKETAIIVFVENEIEVNPLFDTLNEKAVVCDIEQLDDNVIISKLMKVASLYNVTIDRTTTNYLIETSGRNFQTLMNEIRKLIEHAGTGGKITFDDINNLAIKDINSVIFELCDDLATKKIDKAMEVLDNLLYQKEPYQIIILMLYRQFRSLYITLIAQENHLNVVQALGLEPRKAFLESKYKKQANMFKKEELRKLLDELTSLDYNSKIGNIDVDIGLRSILCTYCS